MKIGIPLTAALLLYWIAIGLLGTFVRFDDVPLLSTLVVAVSVSVFVGTYVGLSRVLNGRMPGEEGEP